MRNGFDKPDNLPMGDPPVDAESEDVILPSICRDVCQSPLDTYIVLGAIAIADEANGG